MPYTINRSDGTFLTTVQDGLTSSDTTSTSLTLPSRGATNYGAFVAENFVYLTENFSNSIAPAHALVGQLWFDKTYKKLRYFNGNTWEFVDKYAFGSTRDVGAGATLGGNTNSANRISGAAGIPLTLTTGYSASPVALGQTQSVSTPILTTITVMTSEGKIIAVASQENISFSNLPTTVTIDQQSFIFQPRFPNGISAGITLANDSAGYTYAGSNQFSNTLTQVPYLLGGDDSGTANTMIVSVPSLVQSYQEYFAIESRVAVTNTGATTININNIGVKPVVRRDGSVLQSGDLVAGRFYKFLYDGIRFQVQDYSANTNATVVVADGTTITGNGTSINPLVAHTKNVSAGPTLPVNPNLGDEWFNTSTDVWYIYSTDGTSSFWMNFTGNGNTVSSSSTTGSSGNAIVVVDGVTITGNGTSGSPLVSKGLLSVSVDGVTITGNGTSGSPLKTNYTAPSTASNYTFQLTSAQSLGNAVTTTIGFPVGNATFANGSSSGVTIRTAGLYSLDFSVAAQIGLQNNAGGNGYLNIAILKNGTNIFAQSQNGTGVNYSITLTGGYSYTNYFNVGDLIAVTAYGTGDNFTSNGVSVTTATYINVTKIA